MASWIHSVPKNDIDTNLNSNNVSNRNNIGRERSISYLSTRLSDFYASTKVHLDQLKPGGCVSGGASNLNLNETKDHETKNQKVNKSGHSSSFLHVRPVVTEARRNTITRRLFLAQNLRSPVTDHSNALASDINTSYNAGANAGSNAGSNATTTDTNADDHSDATNTNKISSNIDIINLRRDASIPISTIEYPTASTVAYSFTPNDLSSTPTDTSSVASDMSITPRDMSSTPSDMSITPRDMSSTPSDMSMMSNDMCATPRSCMTNTPSDTGSSVDSDGWEGMVDNSSSCSSVESLCSNPHTSPCTIATVPFSDTFQNKSLCSCVGNDDDDWESIIDDTVSCLTMYHSERKAVPQTNSCPTTTSLLKKSFSDEWDRANLNPTIAFLRNSASCSSIGSCDSDGCSSGDDEGGISGGPCIFDDYCCNNMKAKHYTDGVERSDSGASTPDPCSMYSNEEAHGDRVALMKSIRGPAYKTKDNPTSGSDNNGNGTGSAKSMESLQCEGNCYVSGEDTILIVIDGTVKLKAGSVERFIQRLTCDKHNDPEYTATFLLTYRIFTDAPKVFSLLRQRYLGTTNNMVRLRVCGVLKQWLEKHYSDLQHTSNGDGDGDGDDGDGADDSGTSACTLMGKLSKFLDTVKLDYPTSAAQLKKLVEKKGSLRATTVSIRSPLPNRPRAKVAGFLDFDDLEVARQLTLMEFDWFKQIQPTECLNQAWTQSKTDAPNICSMINRSNTIPYWVATEIVQRDQLEPRVAILRKFISIAEHCRNIGNYNALMEILSGLNMTAIYRLKKTWASLSPRVLNMFQSLNQLMSPDSNFKVYRELLKKDTQPCVPYLGRYLTDIVFTEDAMPLYLPNGLIHFWKCKSIGQIILDLIAHQKQPFMFEIVPEIQNYLQKSKGLTENALLKLSRKLEPKVP